MEIIKVKLVGLHIKGNKVVEAMDFIDLAGRYNISYAEARDMVSSHYITNDELKWYPADWYEEEFLKEEKQRAAIQKSLYGMKDPITETNKPCPIDCGGFVECKCNAEKQNAFDKEFNVDGGPIKVNKIHEDPEYTDKCMVWCNENNCECDADKSYVDQDQKEEEEEEEEGFDFDWGLLNNPVYVDNFLEKQSTSRTDQYFKDRNNYMKEQVEDNARTPEYAVETKLESSVRDEDELGGQDGGDYSANGSSAHYKKAVLEYIDKQERCYGTFLAYGLSFQQVDKYRDRAGKKAGVPVDKDITKANWYDTCSQYLRAKIDLYNSTCKKGKDAVTESPEAIAFDVEYGAGRSTYIEMPFNLVSLLEGEFGFNLVTPLKGLGQIVDELQAK